MSLSLIAPTYPALKHVADRLADEDLAEIAALTDSKPVRVLQRSVKKSYQCFVACWNGEPQAVFGIGTTDSNVGMPWMFATRGIEEWRLSFMKASHRFVRQWQQLHNIMGGQVHAENERAILWLAALGFKILPLDEKQWPNGQPFYEFVWTKEDADV